MDVSSPLIKIKQRMLPIGTHKVKRSESKVAKTGRGYTLPADADNTASSRVLELCIPRAGRLWLPSLSKSNGKTL
jgi:hypothetical protein